VSKITVEYGNLGKNLNKKFLQEVLTKEDTSKPLEEIKEALTKLELSKNEARVYIFLAKRKDTRASEISTALSLNRTETYRVLMNLQKMGLVSSTLEKPLRFVATTFENALNLLIETKKLGIDVLEREKEKLTEIWHSFPQVEIETPKKDVFQILEGYEYINLKAEGILDRTRREVCICASETDLGRFYYMGLLDKLTELSKKRLSINVLVEDSAKNSFFMKKSRCHNVKYLPVKVDELTFFLVSDNEELLLLLDHFPDRTKRKATTALYTNCNVLVKVLYKLFLILWNYDIEGKVKSCNDIYVTV